MNVLYGLYEPTEGTVHVDGEHGSSTRRATPSTPESV